MKSPTGPIRRSVAVEPRETVSLIVSSTVAPVDKDVVAAGWLSVSSPVLLQLREGGRIIGTTESDRLMLPAGDHDLNLVNEALGFNAERRVHVTAGKTALARIDVPNGTMSLNAAPWAEVFVDGERVGETPIGNLSRPIGRHDVLFRHPQLGERHETLVVTLQGTARLGVDSKEVGPCAGRLSPFVLAFSVWRSPRRVRCRLRTPSNISKICMRRRLTKTRSRS